MGKKKTIYVYPTDTVWGIGASIYDEEATELINGIKKSPEQKPLSILYSDVERMQKDFLLDSLFNLEFIKTIMAMEVTLVIDLSLAQISIPSWISKGSSSVFVRCLGYDFLKKIIEDTGAPISTTSLNFSGDPPIKDFDGAKKFYSKIRASAKEVEIIFIDNADLKCSGQSSSIIRLGTDGLHFVREGKRVNEIKMACRLFSAKFL
ncbi:MAG: hypothetical protein A2504_16160 [Bdellovibrionales bacterium RIFOXYD12_FULL_39_22]|nr:MAG: hypothetical protein A2385_08070 [Bdellovibrionales bacterium RIFOXYB1_FULL_39_21]OFZ42986.1 MAG: hypothetical protein A2485_11155 [Bdellovibrionales bacterium RIFOXYC12_FULL_39_17]OFZ50928.1 MAG: hypothetical protein A2404_06985 [Bdellovibrionales bacterium RIFOXYC1_FULL_39_130]OFZ74068.1 MAG: hypothetical protein A2451_12185 [Bdellovibrionales bacterium RIFOXYC2_FULL_39_8]OFZ78151.1 MAG: hypothetical protein A2560_02155 [Bdellovibrionales bacterium RIFOXYD1_FULL_39_84]OFZ94019.1 MAG: